MVRFIIDEIVLEADVTGDISKYNPKDNSYAS